MKAKSDESWLDAEKHFKCRVRKPKRIATKHNYAEVYNDSMGKHLFIDFDAINLSQAKRFQKWLSRAIAYLEQDNDKSGGLR
jgi:hypothetical protein